MRINIKYILIGIAFISILCCLIIYIVSLYQLPTREEKSAVKIVQNWKFYDMTCKDWVDITSYPYVQYGDAETMWSASKEDNQGNYVVTLQIYNTRSDVKFHWRVNLQSNKIIPLEEDTLCPPKE